MGLDNRQGLRTKGWVLSAAVALLIITFILSNLEKPPQHDDAYISYRYARNLANGHGLVYNIGERVEGFTNMLWTLLIAGGIFIGLDAPHFSHLLSLLASSVFLATSFGFAYRVFPSWYALIVPLLTFCSAPFIVWSISGMETPLYAALVVGAFWTAYEGKWRWSGFLAGLCFWTRPDGGLVGLIILAVAFVQCEDRKKWLAAVSIWLVFLGSLTMFRFVYYGSLVPNTFHAKVGGIPWSRGVNYIKAFYIAGPVFLLPLTFLGLKNRKMWPVSLFLLCQTAYVMLIGGDAFFYGRFLLPLIPLLFIVGISASRQFKPQIRIVTWACVIVLWCLFTEHIPGLKTHALERAINHRDRMEKVNARFARLSERFSGPVASAGIGVLGYYCDFRILDMVGLISPQVAQRKPVKRFSIPGHQASNPDWILSQRPGVLILDPSYATLPCQIEMLEHPEFSRRYVQYGPVFVRKDLVLKHNATENSD